MLLDIIMESLMKMDDETLDYALESMSGEELEIVNNYIENASRDDQSDDAYVDALEAAVYELNSMSEEDVIAVLESLDADVVEDLIAMEEGILTKLARKSGEAVGGAQKAAKSVNQGIKDLNADTAAHLSDAGNKVAGFFKEQTPTFQKMASNAKYDAGLIAQSAKKAASGTKEKVKGLINAVKADAAGVKDAFKSGKDSKANESADVISSIREKILAQYK